MLGGGDDIGGGDIGEGEREIEKATVGLNKVGSNSTAELEAAGGDGGGGGNGTHMPPTSVMTRLILIMVWRKLIRNPNTYSSLIGLIWALVAYRSVSQSVSPIIFLHTDLMDKYYNNKRKEYNHICAWNNCNGTNNNEYGLFWKQVACGYAQNTTTIHLHTLRCWSWNGYVQLR